MVAGAIVASLDACGNRGSGDAATTTTPATSAPTVDPTTSTTLNPATEVEQAYLAFHEMLVRLREAPDPDDPEIDQLTTGQTKAGVVNSQSTMKTLGERATFGPRGSVAVLDVSFTEPDTAVVRSCAVEDITVIVRESGSFGPTVTTYWTDYTLRRLNGRWSVNSSDGIEKLEGEQPCDA
jgi:hypothetical protein